MNDLISRKAALEEIDEWIKEFKQFAHNESGSDLKFVRKSIEKLPSAQPDGIPLEWIDKHLEWLDNCDNDFAQLAKVGIRAMVEIWKKDKT